jgi:hypothetical protein
MPDMDDPNLDPKQNQDIPVRKYVHLRSQGRFEVPCFFLE